MKPILKTQVPSQPAKHRAQIAIVNRVENLPGKASLVKARQVKTKQRAVPARRLPNIIISTEVTPVRTHYSGEISEAHIDETLTVNGWVQNRRDHGGVIFIDLRLLSRLAVSLETVRKALRMPTCQPV